MKSLLAFFILSIALSPLKAENADQIFLNGKIITVDGGNRVVDAIAIKGERILAVGSEAELNSHRGPDTKITNLDGACVIPGLIESHCHSIGVARSSLGPAYEDFTDIAEMQAVIRRVAADVPEGQWIRVPRVDITRLKERRHPTTSELDAASEKHPLVFTSARKSALNSLALKGLGLLGDDVEIPDNIEIIRDQTGAIRLLGGNTGSLLAKHFITPEPAESEVLEAMQKVHAIYNSVGITSIFERATNRSGWNLFEKLRANNKLSVRASLTFRRQVNTAEKLQRFVNELRLRPRQGDDWLRAGPLKITVDGGIHWGTTRLSEPFGSRRNQFYALPDDPEYRGNLSYSVEEMAEVFTEAHRLGWQMSCHVTGDAGIASVLEALENSDKKVPAVPMRFNLIHAYFPSAALAQRAAKLGVGVDTQTYLYLKDADFISKIYGQAWADRFIGLGHWTKAGVPVAINADHMIGLDPDRSMNSFNPFLALSIAVNRKDEFGRVYGEGQKLTRLEALRTVTINPAWLGFDESVKGSLEPGKLADLVVLDRDYLTCEEHEMKNIHPILTMVGGRVVFEKKWFSVNSVLKHEDALARAHDVELSGDLAFVPGKGGSIAIINIANPAKPKLIWHRRDMEELPDAETVLPLGNHLLLGTKDFLSLDISDPAKPIISKKISDRTDGRIDRINGMVKVDNIVFAANKNGWIDAFDVSEIESPTVFGVLNVRASHGLSDPHDIDAFGDHIAVVCPNGFGEKTFGQLAVIKIKDAKTRAVLPTDQWTVECIVKDKKLVGANRVQVKGNYAYVAGSWKPEKRTEGDSPSLTVIDISDPTKANVVASIPFHDLRGPNGLTIAGNVVFAAGGETIEAVDITNPRKPVLLGMAKLPAENISNKPTRRADNAHDLVHRDGYLYVSCQSDDSFMVLKIEDARIRELATLPK